MPSALRVSLTLALLLASAPALAADAPIDPALEARIVAMGKANSASAVQIKARGNFSKNAEQSFCILLFAL